MNENQYTLKGILIWLICAIFFLYEFMLRTIIGTFQHPIMYDLELSYIQFSILSSTAYLLIYALMQIPVGLIVDRWGLKKTLLFAALLCSLSSIGFSYSYGYSIAILFRVLTGLGSSFGFICLLIVVYDWMPLRHIAFLIGISQFIGTLGPMFAAGPIDSMVTSGGVDWRYTFLILGILGLILSVFIGLFVTNNQSRAGNYIILKRPESIKQTLRKLLSNSQARYIALFSALVYFTIEYLSENEGKSYIMLKGINSTTAAYMITASWLGYAISCPLLGFISDFIKRRRPAMIISSISCSIALFGIIFTSNIHMLTIFFFLLGVGASGQSVGFAIISEQYNKAYLAAGLSLNNAVLVFLSSINAPILGAITEYLAGGTEAKLDDYFVTFTMLAIVTSASLIFPLFLIRETYCKSKADYTYLSRVSSAS